MAETLIIIQQGTPTVVSSALTFLGTGSAGDPTACRRLVFPSSVSALLAPIVYSVGAEGACLNPDRTLNLDNAVLPVPRTQVVETLGTTKVVRFERGLDDVVVTETWNPTGGASMPTSLFRLLYDYIINASLIPSTGSAFIQWEPRDRTTKVYNVELVSLTVGTGTDLDVADIRADRGVVGDFDNPLTTLNTTPTGLVDQPVSLRMKIISEV